MEGKPARHERGGSKYRLTISFDFRVFAQRQDPTRRGPCQHDFRPELHSIPSRYTTALELQIPGKNRPFLLQSWIHWASIQLSTL